MADFIFDSDEEDIDGFPPDEAHSDLDFFTDHWVDCNQETAVVPDLTTEARQYLADLHLLIKSGTDSEIMEQVTKAVYQPLLDVDISVEVSRACACWRYFEEIDLAKTNADINHLAEQMRAGKCSHHTDAGVSKPGHLISKRLLHAAVASRRLVLVEYLLRNGCDVDSKTAAAHCTPVYLAVLHGRHDLVKCLMKHGADLNQFSCRHTALMEAVELEDKAMVTMLLDHSHCDVNASNSRGETALRLAVSMKDMELVTRLLKTGADPNKMDRYERTALLDAIIAGDTEMCEILINYGADVNVDLKYRSHQCPLMFSVHNNEIAITKLLLEAGADPNFQSRDGFSMLQIAIYTECEEITKLLLDYKAEVNALNDCEYSALHTAAWEGQVAIVEMLLKAGVVHDRRTKDGNTALSLAAHGNHPDVIEMLLPLGCNVLNMDKDLDAPLHYAAFNGCLRTVRALVEAGADPNVRNRFDSTPLWNAVFKNRVDVVRYLVYLNVDLEVASRGIDQHANEVDVRLIYQEPVSPLWVAMDWDYREVTEVLIDAGYDVWHEKWITDVFLKQPLNPNKALLEDVQLKFTQLPPLLHICKMFFRNTYKIHIFDVVRGLEVPRTLKDHLLLKDVNIISTDLP